MAQLYHMGLLFKRLGIVLLIFALCRILFISINHPFFFPLSFGQGFAIFFTGVRYDIAAITIIFAPIILAHLFPFPWRDRRGFQKGLKVGFFILLAIALYFECSDMAYYSFSAKRLGTQNLGMMKDASGLALQFLKDYFWVAIIILAFLFLSWHIYGKWARHDRENHYYNYPKQLGLMVLGLVLFFVFARGGFQTRPLSPATAIHTVKVKNINAAINTSFNALWSLSHRKLKDPNFYSSAELNYHFPVNRKSLNQEATNKNVLVILLESFSAEFTAAGKTGPSYTPFIDSLAKISLYFPNAYACGSHSTEGVISICAGLPGLMDEPILSSPYQNNSFRGLGDILKENGYSTHFFHGGSNGTMFFDQFTQQTGFDNYHGRTEYNNEDDFDGAWGIFDQPFFHYTRQELNNSKKPFGAVLFSLSSHHPYPIPSHLKEDFPPSKPPIHNSLAYTDFALRDFFDSVQHSDWYDETIFIITADHCYGKIIDPNEKGHLSFYRIPMMIFDPNGKPDTLETLVQQTDILPTLISILGLETEYVSFGHNMLDGETGGYGFHYRNGLHYLFDRSNCLILKEKTIVGYYEQTKDPMLRNNLLDNGGTLDDKGKKMEIRLKAIVEQHNERIIDNRLATR